MNRLVPLPASVVLLCAVGLLFAGGRAHAAPPTIPILVDTDPGDDIDDALALGLVLSSPELELRGITTVHGDAYTRAGLLCRFLHLIGRDDIPVSAGRNPLNPPEHAGQLQYALRPGFRKFPVKERAVDFLLARLKADPGKVTLLALGPLTSVAASTKHVPSSHPRNRMVRSFFLCGTVTHRP